MLLQNGKNQIVKIWGGYTPNMYDGYFLDLKKELFRRRLKGAHVIGDDHFRMGKLQLIRGNPMVLGEPSSLDEIRCSSL